MKLLRVISSIDPAQGGPAEAARRIDEVLRERGHAVELVCFDDPAELFVENYPGKVHALGASGGTYRYNAAFVPWLRQARHRFDALIVDGIWQYHSFAVWRALAGTHTPYFILPHGMLDPWFKRTYPIKHIKKWAYWPWAEYRVLRDATAVLFTCEEERRLARKSFWLYRCNEVVTEYGTSQPPQDDDGLLTAGFRVRHPEILGKRVLLFLSRIHEKKGCDLLLRAFAKFSSAYPDLHLVFAGPSSTGLAAKLLQLSESLGIAHRVTWPGMLQGADKWGAFHSAEVFCLPSHQENFGIVVAEALACGKPVLISNKVNIWREIEADGAGIAQDDTLDGTVEALRRWLALTPQAKNRMRLSARHCFDKRFRAERAGERLISILDAHVAAKAGSAAINDKSFY